MSYLRLMLVICLVVAVSFEFQMRETPDDFPEKDNNIIHFSTRRVCNATGNVLRSFLDNLKSLVRYVLQMKMCITNLVQFSIDLTVFFNLQENYGIDM